ncbi:MAG: NRDE family protein [Deltaproteobacteria bacterium]|nr:NRDE family protein [Deltaproteobacteria bacterium]
MCLILLAYGVHPEYRLILAANRDEFYERPTLPMAFWEDHPDILAGRDLKGGGTWLGMSRSGKFSAITNYRESGGPKPGAPSRGHLVSDFLSGNSSARTYLEAVSAVGQIYSGFNLIVGDASGLFYHSNRGPGIRRLQPGWYGLSNHLLNTPWPKVEKGIALLKAAVLDSDPVNMEPIFQLLKNREMPPDGRLPDTGVGMEWERILSPMFIQSLGYGTRSSSVMLIDRNGRTQVAEQTFEAGFDRGQHPALLRCFQFMRF